MWRTAKRQGAREDWRASGAKFYGAVWAPRMENRTLTEKWSGKSKCQNEHLGEEPARAGQRMI